MRTAFGLALLVALFARGDEAAVPPSASEFLVIPLRVHVLAADDLPEVDCKLGDDDIRRIIKKVNGIWKSAGVYWGLESIVREPAAGQDRFRERRDRLGAVPIPLQAFRSLAPEASRLRDGIDVYYIHKFSVNGVYLGERMAFVQETAKLREVEGGIDEPLPRVTAHELGHALGLPHRQARTNLLASGTTGTSLNAHEAEQARSAAKTARGTLDMAGLQKLAEGNADDPRAESARRWRDAIRDGLSAEKP